jgi:hypothetical protein
LLLPQWCLPGLPDSVALLGSISIAFYVNRFRLALSITISS